MTDWIKIEDQLPPINTEILGYAREYLSDDFKIIKCIYHDPYMMKNRKPEYEFAETCGCSGYEFDHIFIEEVTHWMPLPEVPK